LSSSRLDSERLRRYAAQIEQCGTYEVCSLWLYTDDQSYTNMLSFFELKSEAIQLMHDLSQSDIFVLFTDHMKGSSLGVEYVELGYVLQCDKNIEVYLVGHHTNSFTQLVKKQFDTFYDLRNFL